MCFESDGCLRHLASMGLCSARYRSNVHNNEWHYPEMICKVNQQQLTRRSYLLLRIRRSHSTSYVIVRRQGFPP